jgi:ribonuclease Z
MQLIFLGVSAATPTQDRNLPSFALRLDSGELLLFDAGEDVQRRFEAAKLKFNVPLTILISHLHGDHILGLAGLLFRFHLNERTAPLRIIGPYGIASFLLSHYHFVGLKATKYPLTLIEVGYPRLNTPPGQMMMTHYSYFLSENLHRHIIQHTSDDIYVSKEYKIKGMWVDHSVPTMGFRFIEADLDGKFNPDRALEMKIPKGHLWGIMQDGQNIELNGKTIDPVKEGIVTEKRPGRIIAYSADTAKCPEVIELAKNAVFVCESTYAYLDEDLAIEKMHLSSKMAAEIAKEANAKQLILTHFSSRYKNIGTLEEEAREIFPNTRAAKDLMSFEIKLEE